MRKRKADTSGMATSKKVKVALAKKVGMVKIIRLKLKPGSRSMPKIELAPANPIGVSKKFCFWNVPSSSMGQCNGGGSTTQMPGGLVMKTTGEHGAYVLKFAIFGDSSPDTGRPSPPKRTVADDVPIRSMVATPD
jgi:hypothetical protein